MDGYSSASLDQKVAMNFASLSESDTEDMVLMKITVENESSEHFISLDREDYTCYLDEKEILLQAGLSATVKGFDQIEIGCD
jgi:hypothetical protein